MMVKGRNCEIWNLIFQRWREGQGQDEAECFGSKILVYKPNRSKGSRVRVNNGCIMSYHTECADWSCM